MWESPGDLNADAVSSDKMALLEENHNENKVRRTEHAGIHNTHHPHG